MFLYPYQVLEEPIGCFFAGIIKEEKESKKGWL